MATHSSDFDTEPTAIVPAPGGPMPRHLPILLNGLGEAASGRLEAWVDSAGREFAALDNGTLIELYQYRPRLPVDLVDPHAGDWVADSDLPISLLDPRRGPSSEELRARYQQAADRLGPPNRHTTQR